jgi:hypothetical protein
MMKNRFGIICLIAGAALVFFSCSPDDGYGPFLSDNFEDGDASDWVSAGGGYTYTVDSTTAANGTANSLQLIGTGEMQGIYKSLSGFQLSYVSFWVRSSDNGRWGCNLTITGSQHSKAVDGIIDFSLDPTGNVRINGYSVTTYSENTWYHIELKNFDYTLQFFDFWLNGFYRNTYAFSTFGASYIDLYCISGGLTAWYDEIEVR